MVERRAETTPPADYKSLLAQPHRHGDTAASLSPSHVCWLFADLQEQHEPLSRAADGAQPGEDSGSGWICPPFKHHPSFSPSCVTDLPGLMSNMSTNVTVDHCNTPNRATYQIFSWVMVVEFALALPLNLSVLYIFIFRYEQTRSDLAEAETGAVSRGTNGGWGSNRVSG